MLDLLAKPGLVVLSALSMLGFDPTTSVINKACTQTGEERRPCIDDIRQTAGLIVTGGLALIAYSLFFKGRR